MRRFIRVFRALFEKSSQVRSAYMKLLNRIPKLVLVGLLGLSSTVALSACSQDSPESLNSVETEETTTEIDQTAVEAPTTESTIATSETITQVPATGDKTKNVVEVAAIAGQFQTLAQAIEAAGLKDTLATQGPFTLFAPTDEAFAALPEGTLEELLKPENKDLLVSLLTYHVVPGELSAQNISSGELQTVEGSALVVDVNQASNIVEVNDAQVINPNIQASNGIIHAVNKVMLPPESGAGAAESEMSPDMGTEMDAEMNPEMDTPMEPNESTPMDSDMGSETPAN